MQIEAHSIEENIDFGKIFDKADTIAVCYPIYGSCVPLIMREFVKKYIQFFESKKLIIFCTQMLFSGDGAKAFARLIPNCDRRVRYAEHFKMPNNICDFALFPMTEKEKTKKPLRALEKLDKVCSDIQKGIVKKRGWNAFSSILGKTQNIAYPKMEVMTFILKLDSQKTEKRMCLSEHPFGTNKRTMGAAYFLLRGLRKVTGEFELMCLGYNMERAKNLLGFAKIMCVVAVA